MSEMTKADRLLHELLDAAEDIYKSDFITKSASRVIENVILYLYYRDKEDPAQWRASARAIMQKRGLAPRGGHIMGSRDQIKTALTELENLGGIPTVEDIDHWHDTGEVGSLYTWCQALAEILRLMKSKDDGKENLS